jgi:hypothetical protein
MGEIVVAIVGQTCATQWEPGGSAEYVTEMALNDLGVAAEALRLPFHQAWPYEIGPPGAAVAGARPDARASHNELVRHGRVREPSRRLVSSDVMEPVKRSAMVSARCAEMTTLQRHRRLESGVPQRGGDLAVWAKAPAKDERYATCVGSKVVCRDRIVTRRGWTVGSALAESGEPDVMPGFRVTPTRWRLDRPDRTRCPRPELGHRHASYACQ